MKVENFGWCLAVTLDVNKTAGGWEFPVSELSLNRLKRQQLGRSPKYQKGLAKMTRKVLVPYQGAHCMICFTRLAEKPSRAYVSRSNTMTNSQLTEVVDMFNVGF